MKLLLSIICIVLSLGAAAEYRWQLKKETDGIKVYTSVMSDCNVKAVKVECLVEATPAQLIALLLDAKAHEDWVYSTKVSKMLRQPGPFHQIYYSEMELPWPLSNRDVVVELTITPQSGSSGFFVKAKAVEGYAPPVKDLVRVTRSEANWTVTPAGPGTLKIEYIAQADPAGAVPAWIANMFCTKGPYETFRRLRQTVARPEYKSAAVNLASGQR